MLLKKIKMYASIIGTILFICLIIVASLVIINRFGNIIKNPDAIRKMAQTYGIWSFIFFVLCNMLQIFFAPIPGHFLHVSAGIVFGWFRGILVSWLGILAGGSLVMVFSRFLGRKVLHYLLDEKVLRFEKYISRKGLPFIALLSIFPNPVGDGIYYLAGITDIPFRILMPVIFIGRMPGIMMSVLIGNKLFSGNEFEWLIGVCGFVAVLILYLFFGHAIEKKFARLLRNTDNV